MQRRLIGIKIGAGIAVITEYFEISRDPVSSSTILIFFGRKRKGDRSPCLGARHISMSTRKVKNDSIHRLRRRCRCAFRLLCSLSLLLPVGAGCGGWVGGQREGSYYLVERGRMVHLVEVVAQETSTPFNPVVEILVEPCASRGQDRAAADELPCWPQERGKQTQALLAAVATKSPDYRYKSALLYAAQYLNRHLGAWQRTWIVGNSPLAVAFDRNPTELAEEILASRSGAPLNVGSRDAQFVTERDLDQQSNVLVLFPQLLVLAMDGTPGTEQIKPGQQVKILCFNEPKPLRWLMSALLDPSTMDGQAKKVVEIPVRLQP